MTLFLYTTNMACLIKINIFVDEHEDLSHKVHLHKMKK